MWAAGARVPPQRDDVGATGQPGFDDVDEGFIDGERLVAGPIRDTAQSACARKGIGSSGDVWVTIPSTQIASWGRARAARETGRLAGTKSVAAVDALCAGSCRAELMRAGATEFVHEFGGVRARFAT